MNVYQLCKQCENAILNTFGPQLEFRILFRTYFKTVYDSHLSTRLYRAKFAIEIII